MNTPTVWSWAIGALVVGLIAGGIVVALLGNRRKGGTIDDSNLLRADLEAKRDALLARLRDLDETSGAEERARLERETADVLRQLDNLPAASSPSRSTVADARRHSTAMDPTVKGFFWGAGSFAALAGLFALVMQMMTPRQEGGQLTGNLPNETTAQAPMQSAPPRLAARISQLEAQVRSNPNDLDLRNDLAQAYVEAENLMAVFEHTKVVLDARPNDSRALTYQALVRMAMGEADAAVSMLQQAAKSDPKNLDSWVTLAWIYAQQNKMNEASAMIEEAKKQSPENIAQLDNVFRQMQQGVSQSQQQAELPADHPPIDGAGAAPAGKSVTVTLDLDPAARAKSGIVFVIARNPQGGPPAAVKRVDVAQFPITVSISQADSMMGAPLPDTFRLEARLDGDGNAMTKTPDDPSALQDNVQPGATVRLALK